NKLIYRREHESNTSKVFKDERIIGKLNAIRKMYQKYGFNSDGKNKYVLYLRQVVILLSKNNDNRSRKYAKELIFLSPLKLSNIVLLIFSFLGINIKPTWKIYRKFIKKDKI
ncbi:MAG: hypothetical protein U9R41_00935, partial [Candidatus Marinimicrobia bacterium]|nr:hypothetical protein [Candidatus Neomarinimicrobiota bacterium]